MLKQLARVANIGSVWPDKGLPVYPRERAFSGQAGMSPRCQLSSLTCDLLIGQWTSTRTWDAVGRKQTSVLERQTHTSRR